MKRPAPKQLRILGCISFISLILIIGTTLLVLFFPGRWVLTRKLVKFFAGPDIRLVTIPEGFNRFQVAARLQAAGVVRAEDFLILTEEPSILKEIGIRTATAEGYLYPDTYHFYTGGSPMTILKAMTANFEKKFAPLRKKYPDGLAAYKQVSDNPEHAALIMASIVEREVAEKSEAFIVAGIFLKRLTDSTFTPHLLQADPTVAYGCVTQDPPPPSCQSFDGRLTKEQTRDVDNLYNTYIYAGLPPGPICSPGINALTAALDPKATSYFYFVARGDGTHEFSATLDEHNKAVEKYRK